MTAITPIEFASLIPIESLTQFPSIAWDFDETLVSSRNSWLIQAFINAHPEIHHHIVTFRSHGQVDDIEADLGIYRDAPPITAFRSIKSMPDDLWERNQRSSMRRLFDPDFRDAPFDPDEAAYRCWKAEVCRDLGIGVLIDDSTASVELGCEKYNIRLIHPLELT